MYRILYKCPDCRKRPKIAHNAVLLNWSVWCCSTVVTNAGKRVALANWNEMAAAKFARRAVIPTK